MLRWWAELLDSRFRIPGTNIRFGIDPILSLFPGLGDLTSPVFALVLIVHGLYSAVPKIVMLRMVLNALIDALIGVVPIVGNVGDVFFRANIANLALLARHSHPGVRPSTGDYLFVFGILALAVIVALVPVGLAIWLFSAIWSRLFQ